LLFAQTSPGSSYFTLPAIHWDERHAPPCPAFSVKMGSCKCLAWLARKYDPPDLSLLSS
jgi:hypothetical protein